MMGNLVENAARFATSRITVGSGWLGSSVALWVEDDGSGIPADEVPRVFERHFSSDQSSQGRHGTGLGLAIVAELASAMRATVLVQSPASDGRGTRFVLAFAPVDAPQSTNPQSTSPQSTSGSGLASAPTSTE
jgi:two-component system sensor histidine kinase KdpD